MRLSRPASPAGALLLASLVFPSLCTAQETPPQGPAPEPVPAAKAPAPAGHAGLLPHPGGKVRIGIPRTGDRKAMGLKELVAWSVLGSMSGVEQAIETELSPAVGVHEVELAPFLIGKYEVTNAQYHHFLKQAGRVEIVIPPAGAAGPRTLDAISKEFLLHPKFQLRDGRWHFPRAVDWEGLYDLNEGTLNPPLPAGSPPEKKRPAREAFQNLPLPAGVKIVAYRYTVPSAWRARVKTEDGREVRALRDAPLPGTGDQPVTGVSLVDAIACAEYYGCHVPTENQWEACARGPKGEIWPTGDFEPLGMAWSGFNIELGKAQLEAKKILAKGGSLPPAEKARLEWILKAKEIEDANAMEVPVFPVGLFPLGATPCGALDMLGNADEWVSTGLYPYPGTDSKSIWLQARAQVLRGGNALERNIFHNAVIRKFFFENPLPPYARFNSTGFRMARYAMPGASAASHAAQKAEERNRELPILPGEMDPKTRMPKFVGLDIARAAGIERLDEVAWDPAASPASDPTGKVFHLGQAFSLCMVPADGLPFRDIGALRKAADRPVRDPESESPETREPRDIPFLGILHMTPGMEIKAEVLTVTEKVVPLAGEELKRAQAAFQLAHKGWEERRKAEEEARKAAEEEEKKKEGEPEPKPPEEGKIAGPAAVLAPVKGGDKKKDPAPQPAPPAEGGAPPDHKPDDPAAKEEEEEEEPETDPEPVMVTTKKVLVPGYQAGFVKGADHPDGLFVGIVQWKEEKRVVLWEARPGTVGTSAPGGSVLLEPPLAILPKDCIDFKRVAKPLPASSAFNPSPESGHLELCFYIPAEGKSDWFEFRLKLKVTEFPAESPAAPWRATTILKE